MKDTPSSHAWFPCVYLAGSARSKIMCLPNACWSRSLEFMCYGRPEEVQTKPDCHRAGSELFAKGILVPRGQPAEPWQQLNGAEPISRQSLLLLATDRSPLSPTADLGPALL